MMGYFGKLPHKGDFVFRDLPKDLQDQLHAFFESGLKFSRDELQENWIERYSVTPLWHFYLQPGVLNDSAWFGTWMPSVDRVNRHFPFAVIQKVPELSQIGDLGLVIDSIHDIEDTMLDILESDSDAEALLSTLIKLDVQRSEEAPRTIGALLSGTQEGHASAPSPQNEFETYLLKRIDSLTSRISELEEKLGEQDKLEQTVDIPNNSSEQEPAFTAQEIPTGKNLADNYESLESKIASSSNFSQSVWISAGNDSMSPQLVLFEKLPAAEEFHKFLIGFD